MNYRQLKKKLSKLSASQLLQSVVVEGEDKGFKIADLHVLPEDFVSPDGDWEFAEPRSDWESHPEENRGLGRPKVMIKKGAVRLIIKE